MMKQADYAEMLEILVLLAGGYITGRAAAARLAKIGKE